ncbi:hypothetical protein NDU88_000543 [Pleurodeles waltl]|uniref:Uncharacterized protein n=1 Tax=Pleurodeles waltl TaxID=8319 RepID=A0AAV7S4W6_PLEWA|nr:hypothetical protein NDU88_000543 [Pleurodeles waltl]
MVLLLGKHMMGMKMNFTIVGRSLLALDLGRDRPGQPRRSRKRTRGAPRDGLIEGGLLAGAPDSALARDWRDARNTGPLDGAGTPRKRGRDAQSLETSLRDRIASGSRGGGPAAVLDRGTLGSLAGHRGGPEVSGGWALGPTGAVWCRLDLRS